MAKLSPITVQKALSGMDYPATKQELCDHAKEHGADSTVMNFLEQIPNREYDGPSGVSKELGNFDSSSRRKAA
ncbi:MAG TPA: DUF2795 domain-containing protein [Candidatus Saccharimonadia bacterium]